MRLVCRRGKLRRPKWHKAFSLRAAGRLFLKPMNQAGVRNLLPCLLTQGKNTLVWSLSSGYGWLIVSRLLVFKFSSSIARLYMCRRIIRLDELNRLVWRRTKRFSSSRRIMRLSPVFIRDELNDEQNDALKCLAQSRPDALYVCSIKTAILVPRAIASLRKPAEVVMT